MKALIVYYSSKEKQKFANEDKVVFEIEKLFAEKGFSVKTISLETKPSLSLKEQLKKEKELTLKESVSSIKSFDYVVIGSPAVGSFSSAPAVNCFIRNLQKNSGNNSSQKIILFSTGVILGFALKKMTSLLSMKGYKPYKSESFTSIFDLDSKKMLEVKKFFNEFTAN